MFENASLKKIFRPKTQRVTGEWRRLHVEELYDLYPSPNIIPVIKSREIIREEHVARMGMSRHGCRVLVGKTEGKRSLGRTRSRRENNIKMDLQEVGWGMGSIKYK
jgi:hypothetical protein